MKIQYPISGETPECKCIDIILIDNTTYRVNASFDKILRVFDLLKDKSVPVHIRISAAADILVVDGIGECGVEEKGRIVDEILNYFSGGIGSKQDVDLKGNPLPAKKQAEAYRINHDGDIIYAGFMQAYGIDLIDSQGTLHWFKFCALLKGLPKDTKFSEICGYRCYVKPSKNDTYEKQMMKLKEMNALPEEEEG